MPEVVGSGKRCGSSHAAESAFGRPQPGAKRATMHTRHSLAAWALEGDARRRILSSIDGPVEAGGRGWEKAEVRPT